MNYLLEFGNQAVRMFRDGIYLGVEVATPYLEADLQYVKFTQYADTIYLTHPAYQPRKLTRVAELLWVLTSYAPTDGPYLAVNKTTTQFALSNYSYTGRISATADSFGGGDVGKFVEYSEAEIPQLGLISAYVDRSRGRANARGAEDYVNTPSLHEQRCGELYPAVAT